MMATIVRILIGVIGALALLLAARLWLDPAMPAAQLGVAPLGELGLATIRADLGGFFGAAGLFALAAALRNDARLVLTPLVLVGLALTGRLVTAASIGLPQPTIMPIAVEAVLVVLFVAGWRLLPRRG
jgi:hypothetical protein